MSSLVYLDHGLVSNIQKFEVTVDNKTHFAAILSFGGIRRPTPNEGIQGILVDREAGAQSSMKAQQVGLFFSGIVAPCGLVT